ncbi:hypothetical protein ACMFMG_011719 [Clarireedia jacksonii]
MIIIPKPWNTIYFPCSITSIAFSHDSKYLAVCAGENIIICQANTEYLQFVPILREIEKGKIIRALSWSASNSITYLCEDKTQTIEQGCFMARCVSTYHPASASIEIEMPCNTSYKFDRDWKLHQTHRQQEDETLSKVYTIGTNFDIWKHDSKYNRQQGSDDQDQHSNAKDRSYIEESSKSVEEFCNRSFDDEFPITGTKTEDRGVADCTALKADAENVLKRSRDDERSSLVEKRSKLNHRDGTERPLVVSKRPIGEQDSLPLRKKAKADTGDRGVADGTALKADAENVLKRSRDDESSSLVEKISKRNRAKQPLQ